MVLNNRDECFDPVLMCNSIPDESLNSGVARSNLILMCIFLIDQTHQPFMCEVTQRGRFIVRIFRVEKNPKTDHPPPLLPHRFFFATFEIQMLQKLPESLQHELCNILESIKILAT